MTEFDVVVQRSFPHSPSTESMVLRFSSHWTKAENQQNLTSSLSGPFDDYECIFTKNAAAERIINVNPKASHRTRYRELRMKYDVLLEAHESAKDLLMKREVYMRLAKILHNMWFRRLPLTSRTTIRSHDCRVMFLPHLFTVWWHVWHEKDANRYPLPNALRRFPLSDIDDIDLALALINDEGYETQLGAAISEAWYRISDDDAQLMLYCWAARQDIAAVRNSVAHPPTSQEFANAVLGEELNDSLLRRASNIVALNPSVFKPEES